MPTYKSPLKYSAGVNNAGSYMVSTRPWAKRVELTGNSGSCQTISFPKVTKSITVVNENGVDIYVTFAHKTTDDAGVTDDPLGNKNYILLNSDKDKFTMNIRSKAIYITPKNDNAKFTVFAELTNIDANLMYSYNVSGTIGATQT